MVCFLPLACEPHCTEFSEMSVPCISSLAAAGRVKPSVSAASGRTAFLVVIVILMLMRASRFLANVRGQSSRTAFTYTLYAQQPGTHPGLEKERASHRNGLFGTALWPALGRVFPTGGAHGLRRGNRGRGRNRQPGRRLWTIHCRRQRGLPHVRHHFFFFGEQRSHQSQSLHFLLQTS